MLQAFAKSRAQQDVREAIEYGGVASSRSAADAFVSRRRREDAIDEEALNHCLDQLDS